MSTRDKNSENVFQSNNLKRLNIPGAQDQEKGLSALGLITEALNADLGLDQIQARIVQGICEVLNAETGVLILLDEENDEMAIKKTLGKDTEWSYEVILEMSEGLLAESIYQGKPLRVNNVTDEERFNPNIDWVNGFPKISMLCAPLFINGKTLGVVEVINKKDAPFDSFDQELLVAIATSIANAIFNTRLIQQLKVANADLEENRLELLRSRNTLRAFFDSTPTSIYIVDIKHTLIAINMSRAQIVQQRPSDIVGKRCYKILFSREDPCPDCRIGETLFSGKNTQRIEQRWEDGGHPIEFEINTYPIQNENGLVIQAFIFEEDVTEKRRMEATLVQSEKLAAVGQLAAGVAHEINNPLTAIMANTQLLKRMITGNDEIQEMLDLIARAGDRASQVVRNLLDFARKEHYEFAPTDINETIRKSLALVQHELISRQIQLTFNPQDDLPLVLASYDHLQGVWLNLLLNAVDAVEDNGGDINVSTRQLGNEVRIIIADTGKGIPPERVPRIFEPFYTTKKPGRGTGLGLSVCHRIIKQHGGHILVDSQVDSGTEFTIVLPLS